MASKIIILVIGLMSCSTSPQFKIGQCLAANDYKNVKVMDIVELPGAGHYYYLAVFAGRLRYGAPFQLTLHADTVEEIFVVTECF